MMMGSTLMSAFFILIIYLHTIIVYSYVQQSSKKNIFSSSIIRKININNIHNTLLFVSLPSPSSSSQSVSLASSIETISSLPATTVASPPFVDISRINYSTLQGKALSSLSSSSSNIYPTLQEIKQLLPSSLFKKSTSLSLTYAFIDILVPSILLLLSYHYLLPIIQYLISSSSSSSSSLSMSSLLINNFCIFSIWLFYSILIGTASMGAWVTAHECGHGAFSNNRLLQDIIGFIYHSLLLVPYFSWQRSHSLHHAYTNHIVDGESHVPPVQNEILKSSSSSSVSSLSPSELLSLPPSSSLSESESESESVLSKSSLIKRFGLQIGEPIFGILQIILHLLLGWPAYLLLGVTGGKSRGLTNHFLPYQLNKGYNKIISDNDNSDKTNNNHNKLLNNNNDRTITSEVPFKRLFPKNMSTKVWLSDLGVLSTLSLLFYLSTIYGFPIILALYGGPYLIINSWLVLYTWLQHTEVDVPHFNNNNHHFIKGAFHTIDRPYPKIINFFHHNIGSTHVVHHIDSTIPHYHAKYATEIIKNKYPSLYLYESTPILQALWRIATKCYITEKVITNNNEELYVFKD
jgi:omega-6 fatty acid desaturase (delta-12 desaturase)